MISSVYTVRMQNMLDVTTRRLLLCRSTRLAHQESLALEPLCPFPRSFFHRDSIGKKARSSWVWIVWANHR